MSNEEKHLWRSFVNSWEGIVYAFKTEISFRIELGIILVVVLFAIIVNVSAVDAAILTIMIASVLVLELINTAIERIVDEMKPGISTFAKHVKDLTAGAVLVAVVASALVGIFIFLPYLKDASSVVNF